jgi:hypothetical protein
MAGAPLGHFAWGGQNRVLPARLRWGSVVSILLYAAFAVVALERAKLIGVIGSDGFIAVLMWVIAGYLLLGVLMNILSRSKPERYTMTPVALVLAGLALVLALS